MSLKNWVQNGWLHTHKTSPQEIRDLFRIVERDLTVSKNERISNDWRFNIAYNGALQIAIAALAAKGYRTTHEAHHYRAIQSLIWTLNVASITVAELDAFRKKRNISDYERADLISDREVEEIIHLTEKLYKEAKLWMKRNYPTFI